MSKDSQENNRIQALNLTPPADGQGLVQKDCVENTDSGAATGATIVEMGRIVAVEQDPQLTVWVETIKRSTCGTCASKKGCGNEHLKQTV